MRQERDSIRPEWVSREPLADVIQPKKYAAPSKFDMRNFGWVTGVGPLPENEFPYWGNNQQ